VNEINLWAPNPKWHDERLGRWVLCDVVQVGEVPMLPVDGRSR